MPNWCSNILTIENCTEETEVQLHKWMTEKAKNQAVGHLPEFINENENKYFFDICVQDFDSFQFNSKWATPIHSLVAMANKFKFDFLVEYEEMGMSIYGESRYSHSTNTLESKLVPIEDFPDQDSECYYDDLDKTLRDIKFTKEDFTLTIKFKQ